MAENVGGELRNSRFDLGGSVGIEAHLLGHLAGLGNGNVRDGFAADGDKTALGRDDARRDLLQGSHLRIRTRAPCPGMLSNGNSSTRARAPLMPRPNPWAVE